MISFRRMLLDDLADYYDSNVTFYLDSRDYGPVIISGVAQCDPRKDTQESKYHALMAMAGFVALKGYMVYIQQVNGCDDYLVVVPFNFFMRWWTIYYGLLRQYISHIKVVPHG